MEYFIYYLNIKNSYRIGIESIFLFMFENLSFLFNNLSLTYKFTKKNDSMR